MDSAPFGRYQVNVQFKVPIRARTAMPTSGQTTRNERLRSPHRATGTRNGRGSGYGGCATSDPANDAQTRAPRRGRNSRPGIANTRGSSLEVFHPPDQGGAQSGQSVR